MIKVEYGPKSYIRTVHQSGDIQCVHGHLNQTDTQAWLETSPSSKEIASMIERVRICENLFSTASVNSPFAQFASTVDQCEREHACLEIMLMTPPFARSSTS